MIKTVLCGAIIPALYSLLHLLPCNSYLFTTIVKILLFVGVPLLIRHNFKNVLVKKDSKKWMILCGAGAFFIAAIIIIGYNVLKEQFNPSMLLISLEKQGVTESNFILVFTNIIFINAFIEELFFRGYIFFSLKEKNKKEAYIISSVIFALYHVTMLSGWFNPFIFILCMTGLFAGGICFCYAYRYLSVFKCLILFFFGSGWLEKNLHYKYT